MRVAVDGGGRVAGAGLERDVDVEVGGVRGTHGSADATTTTSDAALPRDGGATVVAAASTPPR